MCKPHKRRGAGRRMKDPFAVQGKLGPGRRYSAETSDNRRRFDPSLIHPIRQDETTSDGRRKACLSAPVALPDEQAL
jgi:hypothetical protein